MYLLLELTDHIKASNGNDEIDVLKKCLALVNAQSKCKSAVKECARNKLGNWRRIFVRIQVV